MSAPFIPQNITVHLGAPNERAANVTLPFPDYIKNVASSEIYPTWPENALRANIYAIVTFALNRVYTEHYRSQGYDFDITNSTAFDQQFQPGNEVFDNISRLVDELFNDYVVRNGQIQPYFTQYCNGTTVTCRGLSQWGTVALARQGLTPYEILQRYYGNDISIVFNAPIKGNIQSYPGIPLRMGIVSNNVLTIQRELNRIAANYPSIPRIPSPNGIFEARTSAAVKKFQEIFNLDVDGIVGRNTWYKIKYIYNGVKRLSELYSEGIVKTEDERLYAETLRKGDTGIEVKTVQYYLNFLGTFNQYLPEIAVDGIFGNETLNSVLRFQELYGLDVDGIIGEKTWNRIQEAYNGVLLSLPEEYTSYASLLYPGYIITTGATGNVVMQIQTYINTIAANDRSVPFVDVDGIYGDRTAAAVTAIQAASGLPTVGQVGPLTWNAIINMYNNYR